jgi:hypothetical protein
VSTELPPYDHDAPCPKCHFMAGTTVFFPGIHGLPCAIPEAASIAQQDAMMAGWCFRTVYPDARDFVGGRQNPKYVEAISEANKKMDADRERRAAIPEHFERACPNCKHRWAERPI